MSPVDNKSILLHYITVTNYVMAIVALIQKVYNTLSDGQILSSVATADKRRDGISERSEKNGKKLWQK